MTLTQLLRALAMADGVVTANGDRLHVDVQAGWLKGLLPEVRAHKAELQYLLSHHELQHALADARAYEAALCEPWDDPRWIDVDAFSDKMERLVRRRLNPVKVERIMRRRKPELGEGRS